MFLICAVKTTEPPASLIVATTFSIPFVKSTSRVLVTFVLVKLILFPRPPAPSLAIFGKLVRLSATVKVSSAPPPSTPS